MLRMTKCFNSIAYGIVQRSLRYGRNDGKERLCSINDIAAPKIVSIKKAQPFLIVLFKYM